jgi:hypothetical protein
MHLLCNALRVYLGVMVVLLVGTAKCLQILFGSNGAAVLNKGFVAYVKYNENSVE